MGTAPDAAESIRRFVWRMVSVHPYAAQRVLKGKSAVTTGAAGYVEHAIQRMNAYLAYVRVSQSVMVRRVVTTDVVASAVCADRIKLAS